MNLPKSNQVGNWLLFFILGVALILRFWDFTGIPLTYDEYSSLFRSIKSSWTEVLEIGIRTDAHPALHHSFLHYYIQIFGSESWVVKLPFLLAGFSSVYLVYLIGKRCFHTHTGLIAASFLAIMQFPVMYAQIARPYSFGLLFVLLLIIVILKFRDGKSSWKHVLLLSSTLALCAYTHHFAALAGVLLWFSGWLVVKRENHVRYLQSAVIAVVLYIPHLGVTLDQLAMKGIGTVLDVPDFSFISHHFLYLFHFNIFFVLVFLLCAVISISAWRSLDRSSVLFLLLPWLTVWVVGYCYSVWVAPILQDRILLFILPLMLLVGTAGLAKLSGKWNFRVLTIAVLLTGIFTLVVGRQHYSLFYNSPFYGVLSKSGDHLPSDVLNVLAFHPPILQDTRERYGPGLDFELLNPDSSWVLRDYVNHFKATGVSHLNFGWTPQYFIPYPECVALAREYFGKLDVYESYYHGEYFGMSKGSWTAFPTTFGSEYSAGNPSAGWTAEPGIWADATQSLLVTPEKLWALKYEVSLAELQSLEVSRVYCTLWIKSRPGNEAHLVMEVKEGDELEYWKATRFNDFDLNSEITLIHAAVPLYELDNMNGDLYAYVWNSNQDEFEILKAEFWGEGLNQMIYKLDQPIK